VSGGGGLGLEAIDQIATEAPNTRTIEAFGINDSGDAAGIATFNDTTCGGHYGPFLYANGTVQDLTGSNGCNGQAVALNDSDQVVGNEELFSGVVHAFLWDGSMEDLGTPDASLDESYALAINAGGTIVGDAANGTEGTPAAWVLQSGGAMQLLNNLVDPSLGWDLEVASGVNDSGQIVGWGSHDGGIHGFLLTPAATLTGITVTPTTPTVAVGSTQQFTATGSYSDGSTADLTSTVTWSSTNTAVATIDSSGLLSAAGVGSTTVTATFGSESGSTTVTVTAPPTLTSITITPATPKLPLGATQQFTATGSYSDGSTKDLTNTVTWSSSKTSVATVNASGLLSSLAQGKTKVTATSGSVSASTTVTVGPKQLVSVVISPLGARVSAGNTQQYQAIGGYTDGTSADITTTGAWSSSATKVASIGAHTGLATGKKNGTTTITFKDSSISKSTTLTVGVPVSD
jgi:probable HAF family extracellular repeat protein